jgi:hypothetical protein
MSNQFFGSDADKIKTKTLLGSEYGAAGRNMQFKSYLQGGKSVVGCASSVMRQTYLQMGLGDPDETIGSAIGMIDCNIGGNSSIEAAACICHVPTMTSQFQFAALSSTDLVTLNGQRLTPELGSFPLRHEDICTVGARVFVFLLPLEGDGRL